jgi:hypothetical protein
LVAFASSSASSSIPVAIVGVSGAFRFSWRSNETASLLKDDRAHALWLSLSGIEPFHRRSRPVDPLESL